MLRVVDIHDSIGKSFSHFRSQKQSRIVIGICKTTKKRVVKYTRPTFVCSKYDKGLGRALFNFHLTRSRSHATYVSGKRIF